MFSNISFSACNNLSYGYQLNFGSETIEYSAAPGCSSVSAPNATIGPFSTAVLVRMFLRDDACSDVHYMDGPHGEVTQLDAFSFIVAISDSGGFCESPPSDPRPPGSGNLNLTLTILPPEALPSA